MDKGRVCARAVWGLNSMPAAGGEGTAVVVVVAAAVGVERGWGVWYVGMDVAVLWWLRSRVGSR